MTEEVRLTPTESRIMTVLSDGEGHPREELAACLADDRAGPTALPFHLFEIRRKINRAGQDITCRSFDGCRLYRLVRLMGKSSRG